MSSQYAIVESGVVVNMVLWDGITPWEPKEGHQAVALPQGAPAAIGWSWDGTTFSPPADGN